jgi:hypothetical protein
MIRSYTSYVCIHTLIFIIHLYAWYIYINCMLMRGRRHTGDAKTLIALSLFQRFESRCREKVGVGGGGREREREGGRERERERGRESEREGEIPLHTH